VSFEWTGPSPSFYDVSLPTTARDLTSYKYVSFRAAQITRHPNTQAELGDLNFSVELRDTNGAKRAIKIDAYGGGIEQPYQRQSAPICCGAHAGWAAEFETIRIPLAGYLHNNGIGLDLTTIDSIRLRFSGSAGDTPGAVIFDHLELTSD
jgi:hypothetical protein